MEKEILIVAILAAAIKAGTPISFFTIIVLVIATQETIRRRIGAPANLGPPYYRGEKK